MAELLSDYQVQLQYVLFEKTTFLKNCFIFKCVYLSWNCKKIEKLSNVKKKF